MHVHETRDKLCKLYANKKILFTNLNHQLISSIDFQNLFLQFQDELNSEIGYLLYCIVSY